jgi:hypothetical protein
MIPSTPRSRLPAFLAGALVGAAAAGATVFLLKSLATSPDSAVRESSDAAAPAERVQSAELPQARERIAKLETDNLRLAERIQSLANGTPAPAAVAMVEKKPSANPLVAIFGGEGGTNEAAQAMRGMMDAAIKQQLEGKMRSLKARLNLTAEQEASIREILGQQFGMGRAIAEKMLSGQASSEDVDQANQTAGNPLEQIKALLTPEQARGYDELQQEELRNNARLVANAEMLQMQGALGLSQDQQDSVYKALYTATEAQFGGLGADPKQAMDFRGNLDRKLAALKGVLTEEQFKAYEDMQQQQLKLIESMLPKNGQPGDVAVPNFQVLPRP